MMGLYVQILSLGILCVAVTLSQRPLDLRAGKLPIRPSSSNRDFLTRLALALGGRGSPGIDYPILSSVPNTGFTCVGKLPGYYGDDAPQSRCQVFHVCQERGQMDSFLCPNGTVFNQQFFVCDWWFNFECSITRSFYGLNADFGKINVGDLSTNTKRIKASNSDRVPSAAGNNRFGTSTGITTSNRVTSVANSNPFGTSLGISTSNRVTSAANSNPFGTSLGISTSNRVTSAANSNPFGTNTGTSTSNKVTSAANSNPFGTNTGTSTSNRVISAANNNRFGKNAGTSSVNSFGAGRDQGSIRGGVPLRLATATGIAATVNRSPGVLGLAKLPGGSRQLPGQGVISPFGVRGPTVSSKAPSGSSGLVAAASTPRQTPADRRSKSQNKLANNKYSNGRQGSRASSDGYSYDSLIKGLYDIPRL